MQVRIERSWLRGVALLVNEKLLVWWSNIDNRMVVRHAKVDSQIQGALDVLGLAIGEEQHNVLEAQALLIMQAYKLKLEQHYGRENF